MRLRIYRAAVAALFVLGCGHDSSGTTAPPPTGSLTVTITWPSSLTPAVTVTGPGGYQHALTATTTLTGLAVGSYTIQAAPITGAGPIVTSPFIAKVTGSPVTVSANATANASVTYAPRPGSGGLWVLSYGSSVIEYTATQLDSGTHAPPAGAIGLEGTTPSDYCCSIVFDAAGNLWVANFSRNSVSEYTAAQLAGGGLPTPTVTLSAADSLSLYRPRGLAFDAQGNLWVTNGPVNTVVEYTASQLATSGSPKPAVTLSATTDSLGRPTLQFPYAIALDHGGNLWVTNFNDSTLVEYTASQLGTSGSPKPAVTLSTVNGPNGQAFDGQGNLWVASLEANAVVMYSPAQLAASGSPTPLVALTGGALDGPLGLAFDNSGDLWIANIGKSSSNGSVMEFTASELVASGSPVPAVTISAGSLSNPFALAFNPHAPNLPLRP